MLFFFLSILFAQDPTENDSKSTESDPTEETDPSKSIPSDKDLEKKENAEEQLQYHASEDIVVYGQKEVDRRRKVLESNLKNNGYRDGKRRGEKVVFQPETVWKPSLVVYDSGWVDLKKTPPRFEPWIRGRKDNKWRYLSCIPPFTPMCIRAGGWMISKRRAQHSKTDIVEQHLYDIQFWQEAVISVGVQERLEVDLPDQLDEIWSDPSSRPYTERRKEILDLWSTRTCTPEGNQASKVIALFLEFEVQTSEHPLSLEDLAEIQKIDRCERRLNISISN
mgnify:CR=1 FL=1|tara:strand:+ start:885 stop:1721 length:837 start_codon:yes stop_codon:yes gene_type:complete